MNLGEHKKSQLNKTEPESQSRSRLNSTNLREININLNTSNSTNQKSISRSTLKPQTSPTQFQRKFEIKSQKKKSFLHFFKIHKILSTCLVILVLVSSLGGYFYINILNNFRKTGAQVGIFDPIKSAISAVTESNKNAIDQLEQTDGRTNFLLVGVDARSNNSSYLTDSIMLLSYGHADNATAQISFPRDLKAKYGSGYTKLNSVFPFSMQANASKGRDIAFEESFKNLGTSIEEISGLKVHYGIMINFRGFKDIVDALGGVTVDVERSFIDYEYPNEIDSGVMTVSFQQGKQQMNGTKALQYARSRHSVNPVIEGSDYARARRQQRLMAAIKEKFINSSLFSKVDALNQLLETLGNNIRFYNLKGDDIQKSIASRDILKSIKMYSMVLDPNFGSTTSQLLTTTSDPIAGFLVIPSGKNYDKVKELVSLYIKSPALLLENAKLHIVWTDPSRNKDFTKVQQILLNKGLKFEITSQMIKLASTPTPTGSTAITPTVTTTATAIPSITLYKITDGKDGSIEFYKKLYSENKFNINVKSGSEVPAELQRMKEGVDLLLVVD